jgi:hypothetical protein
MEKRCGAESDDGWADVGIWDDLNAKDVCHWPPEIIGWGGGRKRIVRNNIEMASSQWDETYFKSCRYNREMSTSPFWLYTKNALIIVEMRSKRTALPQPRLASKLWRASWLRFRAILSLTLMDPARRKELSKANQEAWSRGKAGMIG